MSKTARRMCLIFQGLITGFNVELRNNNVIEDMKDTLPSRGLQRQQNCRSAEDDKVQILDTAVIWNNISQYAQNSASNVSHLPAVNKRV